MKNTLFFWPLSESTSIPACIWNGFTGIKMRGTSRPLHGVEPLCTEWPYGLWKWVTNRAPVLITLLLHVDQVLGTQMPGNRKSQEISKTYQIRTSSHSRSFNPALFFFLEKYLTQMSRLLQLTPLLINSYSVQFKICISGTCAKLVKSDSTRQSVSDAFRSQKIFAERSQI